MKKIVYISIGIALLVGIYLSVRFFNQERLANEELDHQRHYIFCEQLMKGMRKKEVLDILSEYGNFEYGESDSGGRSSEIFGSYDGSSIIGETTVHLVFLDQTYNGAYIQIFDQAKSVCGSQ